MQQLTDKFEREKAMVRVLLATFIVLISNSTLAATGFLKGEEVSGLNKICYYNSSRGDFAITQRAASVCRPSADDGGGSNSSNRNVNSGIGGLRGGSTTGFLEGERVNGLNKTCFYSSASGTFTKNQSAASVCSPSAKK